MVQSATVVPSLARYRPPPRPSEPTEFPEKVLSVIVALPPSSRPPPPSPAVFPETMQSVIVVVVL